MKKILSLLLVLALLAGMCSFAGAEEILYADRWFTQIDSFESESFPLYWKSVDEKSEITLYFINGEKGIPYIDMEDGAAILQRICGKDYSLTVEIMEDDCVVLRRENGEIAAIDTENDTISYSHINSFNALPGAVNCLDVVSLGKSGYSEGFVKATGRIEKNVGAFTVDLGAYHIDTFIRDGKYYLPLQTFSDFFAGPVSGTEAFFYNQKCVIYNDATKMSNLYTILNMEGNELTPIMSLYMDAEPVEKSAALTAFNYCELCAMLDYTYGLKEQHNISSFEELFADYGLHEKVLSTDANGTAQALRLLSYQIFADSHSQSTLTSPLSKEGISMDDFRVAMFGAGNVLVRGSKYNEARAEAAPGGYPGYEEIGNTAFITFNTFTFDYSETNNYCTSEPRNDSSDTIALLLYANRELHREDCPIENVVIDLTANVGGYADAAACTVAFFLSECTLNLRDTVTGSQCKTSYEFDLNQDGTFNADTDSVKDKRLFCLISPVSFSCGNMVPACFKASDKVTLIGRTSSGGACSVAGRSTADGNGLNLSSSISINTEINGSYYDVDQGVQPDVYISDANHLCDHSWMAEFINQLP